MSLLVSIAHDSEMLSEKSNQKKLLKIITITSNPEDYVGSVKARSEIVRKSIYSTRTDTAMCGRHFRFEILVFGHLFIDRKLVISRDNIVIN